jgi:hypothetical protein
MPFDPDTEIQYRKGGKIMKKTPRKFQAGGTTTTPPATSSDRVPPAEAAKMKAEKEQQKREKEQQEAGQRRPNLGQRFKAGGKVKKFSGLDGSVVDDAAVEREGAAYRQAEKDSAKELEGNTYGRFGDDTYTRAYNYANQLREPEGAEKLKKPAVRKAAPKAMPKAATPAPKAEPKAEPKAATPAPKAEPKATPKAEPKAAAPAPKAEPKAEPDVTQRVKNTLSKARSGSEDTDKRSVNDRFRDLFSFGKRSGATGDFGSKGASGEYKKGGKVAKYAKGGGIESKGKTAGKIVKMAKGGSVRGYGISKVTNKTKYC